MKRLLWVCLAMSLVGCAGSVPRSAAPMGPVNQAAVNAQVQTQLQQAADSTQASLQELAAIEKLQYQNNISIPLQDVNDPALNQMVSLKWYGPIEPLLAEIASMSGYQLQVLGKPPILPILVNINTTSTSSSAINIIRNADLQAGLKVAILIFPTQKIISLRYEGS